MRHINAGEETTLVCESTYSGNEQPQLDWYRQVHRRHRLFDDQLSQTPVGRFGPKVESRDEFDIRETGPVARQVDLCTVYASPIKFHIDAHRYLSCPVYIGATKRMVGFFKM